MLYNATSVGEKPECESQENCEVGYCILGRCMESNTYYHDAYSTGFYRSMADGWKVVDANQSNWVEPLYVLNAFHILTLQLDSNRPENVQSLHNRNGDSVPLPWNRVHHPHDWRTYSH